MMNARSEIATIACATSYCVSIDVKRRGRRARHAGAAAEGDRRSPPPSAMSMIACSVAMLHFHAAARHGVVAAAGLGADALDRKGHVDLAGLLEHKRGFDRLALRERLLQADEHHMIAARLELDRLPRLDLDALGDRPHLHHAVVHAFHGSRSGWRRPSCR